MKASANVLPLSKFFVGSSPEAEIGNEPAIAVLPITIGSDSPSAEYPGWRCFSLSVVDALERWSTSEYKLHLHCKPCFGAPIKKLLRCAVLYISKFQIMEPRSVIAMESISTIIIKSFSDIRSGQQGSSLFMLPEEGRSLNHPSKIGLIQFLCCGEQDRSRLKPGIDARSHGIHANIIGYVVKAEMPKRTAGLDFKVTLKVSDQSQSADEFIVINFFNDLRSLPQIRMVGDIISIRMGRLQEFKQKIQVCVDKTTEWMIFPSDTSDRHFEAYQQSPQNDKIRLNEDEILCIGYLRKFYHDMTRVQLCNELVSFSGEGSRNCPPKSSIDACLDVPQSVIISATKHDYIAISPVKSILTFSKSASKFNCRLRVTDVVPKDFTLCSRLICFDCLRLTEGWTCGNCIRRTKVGWVWVILLVCEDATGSINVYCTNKHATSFLGGLKAVDLQANASALSTLRSRLNLMLTKNHVFHCSIESVESHSGRIYSLFDTTLIIPE